MVGKYYRFPEHLDELDRLSYAFIMNEAFLERLRALMERDGITSQYQLAKKSGIDYRVLNNWFARGNMPDAQNLLKLAAALNVTPSWLRYGDERFRPTLRDDVMGLAAILDRYVAANPWDFPRLKRLIVSYVESPAGEMMVSRRKRKRTA